MKLAIEVLTTDGESIVLRHSDGSIRLYDELRVASADALALPGCRIDPQLIESVAICDYCPVRWFGEEAYSREEAAAVCWKMADRTGEAYVLLGNRHVGVWSVVPAEKLKSDDDWLNAWQVEAIRDLTYQHGLEDSMAPTLARKIAAMIRSAEAQGCNLYWSRGEHQATLRVIRARTKTEKSMLPRTYTQVYCLPCGEWLEFPEVCLSRLGTR